MWNTGPLLGAAFLKVEWSRNAAMNLQRAFNAHIERTASAAEHFNKELQLWEYVLKSDPIPAQAGLILGDSVHNLRSSLDTAISELVVRKTGRMDRRVNFPIARDKVHVLSSFKDNGTSSIIRKHLPDLEEIIVQQFKPWEAENINLYNLSQLDNLAKHNIILLVYSQFIFSGFDFYTPEGHIHQNNVFSITAGEILPIGRSRELIVVTRQGSIMGELVIGPGQPGAGTSALDLLKNMTDEVTGLLQTLRSHFGGSELVAEPERPAL